MCVVLKFPLDRVPRANDCVNKDELHCAQIIMFDGVRYSRGETPPRSEFSDDSKPESLADKQSNSGYGLKSDI